MKKRAYDFQRECRIFAFVMLAVLVIIMIFGILSVCELIESKNVPEWKPSVSYPMANAHISWDQTFYGNGDGMNGH